MVTCQTPVDNLLALMYGLSLSLDFLYLLVRDAEQQAGQILVFRENSVIKDLWRRGLSPAR